MQCKVKICLYVLLSSVLYACGNSEDSTGSIEKELGLTVYKTESCSCCSAWVDHIQRYDFAATVVNQKSIAHIKDYYGVPENARSCHTAISEDGYLFEGHVPAKYMRQFLDQPSDGSAGLVVPAMPLGSPGMEVDDQFNSYTVFSLDKRGILTPYVFVETYAQQFD